MSLPATEARVSKSQWFDLSGYTPHLGQDAMHRCPSRFRVLCCGRRWGKSLGAAKEAEVEILTPGTRGWVVSKNYSLAEKVMRQIYKDLIQNPDPRFRFKPTRKQWTGPYLLEFPWDSVVEGKSADHPDGLLGEGLDWLIFDECAPAGQKIWEQFLRPTLTDRGGWALFISTPRGYNWFYDIWMRGSSEDYPDWSSFRHPSWDNPHLSQADIEEARRTIGDATFRQEYGAEFTISSGQVYQTFDETKHIIPASQLTIHKDWPRYRAIDFGYENPFCCLWITVDPEDRVIIYDEYYRSHRTNEKHARAIVGHDKVSEKQKKAGKDFRIEWTVADASGPSARATLQEAGVPNISSLRSIAIETGLDDVRRCLTVRDDGTPGLLVSSKCVNTIKEFNLYCYPDDGLKELPLKKNDHAMDALRYFVVSWKRGTWRQEMARL